MAPGGNPQGAIGLVLAIKKTCHDRQTRFDIKYDPILKTFTENSRFLQLRWEPTIQPQEPILLPKFRIRFADFPYPRSFHGLEATQLGDLLRILVRSGDVAFMMLSRPRFSRFGQKHSRRPEKLGTFYQSSCPISGRPDSRAVDGTPAHQL